MKKNQQMSEEMCMKIIRMKNLREDKFSCIKPVNKEIR